jgi:hypothetical protein
MKQVGEYVIKVIAVIFAVVQMVERPGDGQAKKQEAVDAIQALLLLLPVPLWVKAIFGIDAIIALLVDLAVKLLNKSGWFAENPTPA